jgi:hypothetical protein
MGWRRLLIVPVALATLAQVPASDIPPDVRIVLSRDLKFSAAELAGLERGQVVKHAIETRASGEVAVVGAVRVKAPKAGLFERVRDIARFKRGPNVLQIGRLGNPPSLDDIAALTVDKGDFDVLNCRVGDCPVRLPADVIRRFQREIGRQAPDAQARGAAMFKQVLIDDVKAYVSGQPGRMLQYDDGSRPIRPVDEFASLLKNATSIGALIPGLPDHLLHFPARRLPEAEDFLYWSKEKFASQPFITVTHVTILCPSVGTCVMTTKDVYSSRYLDASLALTIASDAVNTPGSFYLLYGNRSRANALKGVFSSFRRSVVQRRARASLDESLTAIRLQLEKSPSSPPD